MRAGMYSKSKWTRKKGSKNINLCKRKTEELNFGFHEKYSTTHQYFFRRISFLWTSTFQDSPNSERSDGEVITKGIAVNFFVQGHRFLIPDAVVSNDDLDCARHTFQGQTTCDTSWNFLGRGRETGMLAEGKRGNGERDIHICVEMRKHKCSQIRGEKKNVARSGRTNGDEEVEEETRV